MVKNNFKPPYWYHDNIKFSDDEINNLKNYLLREKNKNTDFLDIVYKNIVDDITKKVGVHHLSRYDYTYWLQLYQVNDYHGPHNHAGEKGVTFKDFDSHISWVHFLDTPKQKCFRFTDTKGNTLVPDEQSSGDIICFPSWVWHEVTPLETDYLRLVTAGNISFKAHDLLYSYSGSTINSSGIKKHHTISS